MNQSTFEPPPIALHVYQEHIKRFGEPDDGWVFDQSTAKQPAPAHFPRRIDVFVWNPTPELDITSFTTMGMCTQPMTEAEHRAELHFAVRKRLSDKETHACAWFLANLAMYPFHQQTHFDWWHKIRHPGTIPEFPHAAGVWLHARFAKDGWDRIEYQETTIKLLNVIPISAKACEHESRDELASYVWDELRDPFTPW